MHADLLAWGFNSVGWVQEYVAINDQHHRHSRSPTPEESRWLNMPYGHLLPLIESNQWEIETRLPKIDNPEIAEWCDSVARDRRKVPLRGRERLAALTIACDWNSEWITTRGSYRQPNRRSPSTSGSTKKLLVN